MTLTTDHRKWGWLDAFLFIVRTIWITNIGYTIWTGTVGMEMWLLLLWACCFYLIPHVFYRPKLIDFPKFVIAEALLTGSFYIFIASQYTISETYGFLFLPLLVMGYVCQIKPLFWLGPIMYLAIFLTGSMAGNHFTDQGFLGLFFDTTVFYGIGLCLGRVTVVNNKNKALLVEIEEKNRDLVYYAGKIEELTLQEERNRVSQDLHDTVGHIFTSVITSLDALPYVYQADRIEAEKSMKALSTLARNGLHDVRQTIHHMSSNDQHTLMETISALIADFQRHTGTVIHLSVKGEPVDVTETIKFALVRCVQEGLTNAKRHGQATAIAIHILFTEEALVVHMKDNGIGCHSLELGFGLRTMKERISSLGGTVNFASKRNDGLRITCSIPIAKEVSKV